MDVIPNAGVPGLTILGSNDKPIKWYDKTLSLITFLHECFIRSPRMDQTPDASFRKYFDWPTHKDPKGTIKIETVIVKTSLPEEIPRGYVRPTKKKKRMAVKTPAKFTDEDFLLLEAFLWEISVTGSAKTREQVPSLSQDQVIKFVLFILNQSLNFLATVCN